MNYRNQWRVHKTAICAMTLSLFVSACSDTNQTQKIEQHIDSASEALKQQVRDLRIEEEVAEMKRGARDFARDVTLNDQTRKLGSDLRDGMRDVSNKLDEWMTPRQTSSTREATPQ